MKTAIGIMVSLSRSIAFAESRIRAGTIAAEDVLLDMGAISIISSDAQGMGRAGETVLRTWQLASKMKQQRGALPEETNGSDNQRVLRYLAKYTINPAIALGIDPYVGSFRTGSMADIVIWKKEFFGAKPEYILKQGFMVMSAIGDPNASTKASEPLIYRKQFGAYGGAVNSLCKVFVTQAALDNGLENDISSSKGKFLPITNTRNLNKDSMVRNSLCPKVQVDRNNYDVLINGVKVDCQPWDRLPLTQKYYFR